MIAKLSSLWVRFRPTSVSPAARTRACPGTVEVLRSRRKHYQCGHTRVNRNAERAAIDSSGGSDTPGPRMSDELRTELANLRGRGAPTLEVEADLGNVGIAVPVHRVVAATPARARPGPTLIGDRGPAAGARARHDPGPSSRAATAPDRARAARPAKTSYVRLAQLATEAAAPARLRAAREAQAERVRAGQSGCRAGVRRRRSRRSKRISRGLPFVGPAGQAARPDDRSDGLWARRGLHLQHGEVPAAGEPHPAAGRGDRLRAAFSSHS